MANAKKKTTARQRPAAKKAAARQQAQATDDTQPQGNEGPIPARFSGEPAPEPDAVVMSEEERADAEHEARLEHNARTGGGELIESELEVQRVVHNARTGGVSRDQIAKELDEAGFKY